MSSEPNPYAHLNSRQTGMSFRFEEQAASDGSDLKDLLDASDLPNADKAALALAWGGPEAAAEYQAGDSTGSDGNNMHAAATNLTGREVDTEAATVRAEQADRPGGTYLEQAWGGAQTYAKFRDLSAEQRSIANTLRVAATAGQDPRDTLHRLANSDDDKAAVARQLYPEAASDWTGDAHQRNDAQIAFTRREQTRHENEVVANAERLDPTDQSQPAHDLREAAGSIRDFRAETHTDADTAPRPDRSDSDEF